MFEIICDKNNFATEWESEGDKIDRRSFMNFRELSRITIGKNRLQKERKPPRKHLSEKTGLRFTIDDSVRSHHNIGSVGTESISEDSNQQCS